MPTFQLEIEAPEGVPVQEYEEQVEVYLEAIEAYQKAIPALQDTPFYSEDQVDGYFRGYLDAADVPYDQELLSLLLILSGAAGD